MILQVEIVVCFLNCAFALMTYEERMKDRMEPVLGVTYFGSEQLLNTEIETVKPFIADFTLPKHALNVTASQTNEFLNETLYNPDDYVTYRVDIPEWSTKSCDSDNKDPNGNCTQLVAHFYPPTNAHALISAKFLALFDEFAPECIEMIEELWIMIYESKNGSAKFYGKFVLNITHTQFTSLKKLHVISMIEQRPATFMIVLPLDFDDVSNRLQMIHFRDSIIVVFNQADLMDAVGVTAANISFFSELEMFVGAWNGSRRHTELEIVSLQNSPTINTKLLSPLLKPLPNLVFLEQRGETSVVMPKNLAYLLPSLLVLDISHNLEGQVFLNSQYEPNFSRFLAEALLLSPRLELFISVNNFLSLKQMDLFSNRQFEKNLRADIPVGAAEGHLYLNQGPYCLSVLWNTRLRNRQDLMIAMCNFTRCFFGLEKLPCDREYFVFDFPTVRMPISPNLQEVYVSNMLYPQYSVGNLWSSIIVQLYAMFSQKRINIFDLVTVFQPENKLSKLDMSFETLELSAGAPVINLMLMSMNYTEIIGLDSFETLNMNYARLNSKEKLHFLASPPIKSLRNLYLRATDVTVPESLELCLTMENLTKIDLSKNNIHNLPKNLFKGCADLSAVNLSRNSITTIPDEIHAWIETHDVIIDLSGNPIGCHCHSDVIKTITWLHKHKNKYHGFAEYSCYGFYENPHGYTLIVDINANDYLNQCQGWLPEQIAALVVTTATTTLLFVVAAYATHKYRYRVVMNIYRLKRLLSREDSSRNRNVQINYELFLSYCREDENWVHHILIPELEDIHGITCCVHLRDFPIVGKLSQTIHRYMDESRYILVVMSRHSVNKHWPAFELEHAQDLARTQGKKVFYVKLGDLGDDITPEVKQVLDGEIYIEWPEGVRNQKWVDHFFDRLVGGIRGEQICGGCQCFKPTSWRYARRDMPYDEQIEMTSIRQDG